VHGKGNWLILAFSFTYLFNLLGLFNSFSTA
jgi:hypothetical protein